jgi:hypothetical protein
MIYIYEGSASSLLYEGGAGVRAPLGPLYIEAYGRAGSPFLWGAGFSVGYDFDRRKRVSSE